LALLQRPAPTLLARASFAGSHKLPTPPNDTRPHQRLNKCLEGHTIQLANEAIWAERVTVDGEVETKIGRKIIIGKHEVTLDGVPQDMEVKHKYGWDPVLNYPRSWAHLRRQFQEVIQDAAERNKPAISVQTFWMAFRRKFGCPVGAPMIDWRPPPTSLRYVKGKGSSEALKKKHEQFSCRPHKPDRSLKMLLEDHRITLREFILTVPNLRITEDHHVIFVEGALPEIQRKEMEKKQRDGKGWLNDGSAKDTAAADEAAKAERDAERKERKEFNIKPRR